MSDSLLMNLSVLYRNVQKYYDKALIPYEIGYGQLMFLFLIHENEGITMQEVSRIGEIDKGTTTKSIQKLMDQGYVVTRTDENDHRVKRLYTTTKSVAVMPALYDLRNTCRNRLAMETDLDEFEDLLQVVCVNSRNFLNPEQSYSGLQIAEMEKVSMDAYPDRISSVIRTGGCSMKCPYCHHKYLVFVPDKYAFISPDQVLNYLEERKDLLDGVCISGGEPLLQDGLEGFIKEIKEKGYQIKLNTNGYHPEKLKKLMDENLLDYISLDLKNTKEKYAETCGLNQEAFAYERIEESFRMIKESHIPYEVRTTVVQEFHTLEDLKQLAYTLQDVPKWILQSFVDGEDVIQPGFHAYSRAELSSFVEELKEIVPTCTLR